MIVRTPKDLLMRSSSLSAKHQSLQDQILTMEADIFVLDEKYKKMVREFPFIGFFILESLVFNDATYPSTF